MPVSSSSDVVLSNIEFVRFGISLNYHIGAAYYLKVANISFEELWEDYLEPLLSDYIRGMFNEEEIMELFKSAYNNSQGESGLDNEID